MYSKKLKMTSLKNVDFLDLLGESIFTMLIFQVISVNNSGFSVTVLAKITGVTYSGH